MDVTLCKSDMTGQQDGVEWRRLELSDLPGLAPLAPGEWDIELDAVLAQHVGRGYFHGLVGSTTDGGRRRRP